MSGFLVKASASGFPDFGLDPDFFDQTGLYLVWNFVESPHFSKKK